MNDEQQIRELLMTAAELPYDLQPPVARLLRQGQRRRTRRTTLMAATAAVAVLAAGGIPAAVHALRTAPGQGGGYGLFGPRPPAALTGPAAARLARFRWSKRPPSPLGARRQPVVAWTGRELLELGGTRNGTSVESGAAYNPATGRWHLFGGAGQRPVPFPNAVSVWTGRQLFVTSGQFRSCVAEPGGSPARCGPQAALYDPVANRWTQTRMPAAMAGLEVTEPVWTGRDVILAGANPSRGRLGVAAYNPATRRWRVITPVLPAGHPVEAVAITATTSRLILWSMWERRHKHGAVIGSGVDVLALGTAGTWRDVTGHWPQRRSVTVPQFTGTKILVSPGQIWCGNFCNPPYTEYPGYFVDPVTLARTRIPSGPIGQADPAFVWTGRAVIAVNVDASIGAGGGIQIGAAALFDPGTRQWQKLPDPPGYPHLSAVNPVWAGNELLVVTASGQLVALHG